MIRIGGCRLKGILTSEEKKEKHEVSRLLDKQ